jgi:hypothetical protein
MSTPFVGQGLDRERATTMLSSSFSYASLQKLHASAKKFKRTYRASPRTACRKNRGSLCAGSTEGGGEEYIQLFFATAPLAYSNNNLSDTGKLPMVAPALDQGSCR